jgi:hypothetical protein
MVKTWHCRDSVTQAAYDGQAASLRDRNRHRDTHMDYSEVGYPSISIPFLRPDNMNCSEIGYGR